jgi:hypothetical protein
MSRPAAFRRRIEPVAVTVYDGRTVIGEIRSTPDSYRALDAGGADLGLFNTSKSAVDALLACRKAREAT